MTARSKGKPDESDAARDARRAAEHAQAMAEREEAKIGILRLVYDTLEAWRKCSERNCRRNRRCGSGPTFPCSLTLPPCQATEEEKADAMADLKRALDEKLREAAVRGENV